MDQIVKYETDRGIVELTNESVKKYLVSGDVKLITDNEIMMFIKLCQYQKLNPFLREAYLIKYSEFEPAQLVVAYDVYLKRSQKNPKYRGFQAGIVDDGVPVEKLKAWCEVFMDEYPKPIRCEVYYSECVSLKKDGTPNKVWKKRPKGQLVKCAVSIAHRWACTKETEGMLTADEMGNDGEDMSNTPIIDAEIIKESIPSTTTPPSTNVEEKSTQELTPVSPTEDIPAGRQAIKVKIQAKLLDIANGDMIRVKGLESEIIKTINSQYDVDFLNLNELLNDGKMEILTAAKVKTKTMHDKWKSENK